jgi:hypothetical protein
MPILLKGKQITLTTPQNEFLAEKNATETTSCLSGSILCRLLRGSYIYVSPTDEVFFELRLCYDEPNTLVPEILQIRTPEEPPPANQKQRFPLNDVRMKLYTFEYLCVRYNDPLTRTLQNGSSYNPSTGELVLKVINPELPSA